MDEKQRITQEIQRVANLIAPEPLTRSAFLSKSSISRGKIRYHFGTWNRAVKAAGLEPNPPGPWAAGTPLIPDEELLREIGDLWRRLGRRPSRDLMNSEGKYSVKPYLSRWKSFSQAVDAYVKEFGEPDVSDIRPTKTELPLLLKSVPLL